MLTHTDHATGKTYQADDQPDTQAVAIVLRAAFPTYSAEQIQAVASQVHALYDSHLAYLRQLADDAVARMEDMEMREHMAKKREREQIADDADQ